MPTDSDEIRSQVTANAVYILEGEHICHECGCFVPVLGLMLVGPFQVLGDELIDPSDDSAILRRPTKLPIELAKTLHDMSHGCFRQDFSRTVADTYWMNHCRECDAKIGDWFVHKPGEAFFPTSADEVSRLKGRRVDGPFSFLSPDLSMSSWTSIWLRDVGGR